MKNKDILTKVSEIDKMKEDISNIDLTSEKVTMNDGKRYKQALMS